MIKLEKISHSFGDKIIFNSLSLTLDNGIYALVGKSGSGKTTLLKIIAGLIRPESGSVESDKPLSVSFQENRLFPWYSALKNVSLVTNSKKAEALLTELGLNDSINKKPSELSGGMKRRVSLARALAAESKTILLDEPFAGLDDETANATLDVIKNHSKNKVVLISTHNISIAEKLDGIVQIDPSI